MPEHPGKLLPVCMSSDKKIFKLKEGFTLIEVILSLTIMSLVIMVLYQAFAIATRVWSHQQSQGELLAREQGLNTLLRDDFARLSNYTFNSSKGRGFFFAGGQNAMFYVTTNGFGAREHHRGGLYFTCVYLADDDDEGKSFYLYKSPYPEQSLLDALEEFRQLSPEMRVSYQLPAKLKQQSTLIISALQRGSFSYDKEEFIPPGENDNAGEKMFSADYSLSEQSWSESRLPVYLLFSYQIADFPHQVLIHLTPPPAVKKSNRPS